jgi:hypothetical protein
LVEREESQKGAGNRIPSVEYPARRVLCRWQGALRLSWLMGISNSNAGTKPMAEYFYIFQPGFRNCNDRFER